MRLSQCQLNPFNLVLHLPYRLIVSPHSQRLRTPCLLVLCSSGTLVLELSDFLEHLVLLSSNPRNLLSSNNLNLVAFLVSSGPQLFTTTAQDLFFPGFPIFMTVPNVFFFCGRMPLFLFIFHILLHTYIHLITFIQYIYVPETHIMYLTHCC